MKKIYYGENIVTMEDELYTQAVLIDNNKISAIGNYNDIIKLKDDDTKVIDLKEKCLMPSFIDSHSHITALAQTLLTADLSNAKNFDDIINILKDFKEKNNLNSNNYLIGFGYDHNFLEERKHPTKEILDKVSNEIPVLITHKSGHMGVTNSLGLKLLNIDENTKAPDGGKIGRTDITNKPNGYLEETAFTNNSKKFDNFSMDKIIEAIKKAENIYLSYGITTAQDGITKEKEFSILKTMSENNNLDIDIVSYIDIKNNKNILEQNKDYLNYINHYKIGGYKLFLDGSPQGKTAWLSKPYEGDKEYKGYPIYKDEEVKNFIKTALNENIQIITHCNGDAAAEQFIKSFEALNPKKNIRPVMIHAQTVREDQIKRMKKINMIPSFFVDHVYYWGDIHLKNLGERAYKISPIKTAIKNDLIYTIHEDTPVLYPDILESIWTAATRTTKNGVPLSSDEKITIVEGLKAVTINAAYSYFEEDTKGSIKEGKLADLVILDKNPLKLDNPDELKKIKLLETIKEGKTLYKNN
ncbi:amidohydrolase [Anaerofustis stercorihominis]|uniref:amidohydrolase n=1 Tax=Anaerofustis stercorihominis TaxID=214853 RepID=UPI00214C59B0|nr:amidohydrolase [Anaerofustis stercorihominis]MCR2032965.1 amidohydrolase [Anaerofustis stercorihominis]